MAVFNDVRYVSTEEYFNNNEYAVDMFESKYANNTKDRKETPAEVFYRVASELANFESEDKKQHYTDMWFDLMYKGWFRPGGSIISGIGSGRKSSLANCFHADTQFITSKGIKSFNDFNHGDNVEVLTRYAAFNSAVVNKYGKDYLTKIKFQRNGIEKEFLCTNDHSWLIRNKKGVFEEKTTNDLEIGNEISNIKKKWMLNKNNERYFCPIGFIHGLVFGDGSYYKKEDYCQLTLCGDSVQYIDLFKGFDWNYHELQDNKIRIQYLPNYMKDFPDFDNVNSEYILGFFIGWLAADGSCSKTGLCELTSSKFENLEKIRKILPSIGINTSNVKLLRDESPFDGNKNHKCYRLYILRDCLFPSMFVKKEHLDNYYEWMNSKKLYNKLNTCWKVKEIEYNVKYDETWCIEEPETNTFVLDGGILTHNCTTIPIEDDTIEAINKAEYVLMKCAAYRQGMGIDLSNLRPRGSKLGNAAEESTGIVPWAKKYSNVGKYVGQRGRMPAVLESLKDYHPDIEEFINSKREKGEIENANISVQISDNFMNALENNDIWELKFDTEHESIRKEIDPNYLFDLIAEAAWESAEPAVQYIDRLRASTISHAVYEATGNDIYKVISTNACCFTDDMVVSTNKGYLSISKIRERFNNGDEIKILSYDIQNNNFEYQDLEATHTRDNENPQEIIELMIEKDIGEDVKIECTPDHKIYTKNRGWVKAIELIEDDVLCES